MADRRDEPDEVIERWSKAKPKQRNAIINRNGPEAVQAALNTRNALRPEQMPPDGNWAIWVILAGRGFGNPVEARAIRLVTESAGGAPFVSDPARHPALGLLASAGFGASGPGLIRALAAQLLLHGNA